MTQSDLGGAALWSPPQRDFLESLRLELDSKVELSLHPSPIEPPLDRADAPPERPGTRILFFGIPSDYGVAFLLDLLLHDYNVVGIVTSGRGELGRFPADRFDAIAAELGLPKCTLKNVNAPESLALFRPHAPELIAIASLDQIFKAELLNLPRLGCVNVHPSLLPSYRGPDPRYWEIFEEASEGGITIHLIDERIDAGVCLHQAAVPIGPEDSWGTLAKRCVQAGLPLLRRAIDELSDGTAVGSALDLTTGSYHPAARPGPIDWSAPAAEIDRLVRAGSPDKPPFTYWQGQQVYVTKAKPATCAGGAPPGTIVEVEVGLIHVAAADAEIEVSELRVHDEHGCLVPFDVSAITGGTLG
ncbi:MAG: methionyl-tRNA formyltransferase [Chloroflexi bacterium]|nr:methionyl-tRNA formyltransferase [Chloroflexota bacterium]